MSTKINYAYSPSRNAFYSYSLEDAYINSSNGWPSDAVDVDDATVNNMFEGQKKGLVICAGRDGKPTLLEPEIKSLSGESLLAGLIQDADAVIQPLIGYALAGIMSDDDKARFKAWNEYRKALEGVDVTAADIEWPDKPE